jgi:hypothetical protein
MKITIEGPDHSVTITFHDHIEIDDLAMYLKQLLMGYGFHPDNVNEIFAEEA